jgi:hypothetical protein
MSTSNSFVGRQSELRILAALGAAGDRGLPALTIPDTTRIDTTAAEVLLA